MNNKQANILGNPSTSGCIPKDWEILPLGTLGVFSKGKGILKEQVSESGIPCIRYGEIYTVHDYIIKAYYSFIKEELTKDTQLINKGDILFACSGETIEDIGKAVAFIQEERVYAGGDIIVLSPKIGISSTFLSYTLDSSFSRSQKRKLGQGNQVVHIYANELAKLLVPLPPLPEQTAIATLLSTWNKAIELNTKLLQAKQQRKKWLMQVLLTGKKRLPGFEGEWRKVKLGEIFNRVTTKNLEQNSTIVTVSAQRGLINQDEFFNKIVASESLANYFLIERGDFVYNKSYSNGYDWGAVKRLKEFEKAVVTTLYICFRMKTQLHSPDFLEFLFEASQLDHGLMKIAHEGGRAHGLLNVTPDDFFNLEIIIPEPREQLAIATTIAKVAEEIDLISFSLEKMKEQKKGLMQVLLTGKKRLVTQ